MGKREMGGDGENDDGKLALERILCISACSIHDTPVRTPDPLRKNTDTKYSKPNQVR